MKLFTRLSKGLLIGGGLALGLLAGSTPSFAQFNFNRPSFTNLAGTYTAVSGGASVISVAPNNDDGVSTAQAIGFNFPFNGQTMTHFILSSNGWIKLGTSAGMAAPVGPQNGQQTTLNNRAVVAGVTQTIGMNDSSSGLASSDARQSNVLSVFNWDLKDGATATPFPFTYETTGSVGSRVCTIQWTNRADVARTATGGNFGDVNFQIKIYETTGVVEYHYGSMTNNATYNASTNTDPAGLTLVHIGIKGTSKSDGAGSNSCETQLTVTKAGSTTAWSAATAQYNFGGTTFPYGVQTLVGSVGMSVRATNSAGAFQASLTPANGVVGASRIFRFTPVSPAQATIKYSPTTASIASGTYTDLAATGTAFAAATPTADDGVSAEQSIGFTFQFGTTTVDKFILCSNGYLKLGTAGMSAPTSNLFGTSTNVSGAGLGVFGSDAAADVNMLAPFNMDLQPGAGVEYRVATTGSPGSRICTIQWKNMADKVNNTANPTAAVQLWTSVSFQVRLYETTGQIDYVYKNFTNSGTNNGGVKSYQCGIKGLSSGSNQTVVAQSVSGNFSSIALSRTQYVNLPYVWWPRTGSAASVPTSGATITFPLTYPNDLRAALIYTLGKWPIPFANPGNIHGVVTNVGDNNYAGGGTANFNLSAPNLASGSASIPAIVSADFAELDFGNYSPASLGNTTNTMSLPADDNAANNVLTTTTNVNSNTYSYKDPSAVNNGGVGFTGGTGAFVAGFNSASSNVLNSVKVDFQAGTGVQYKLAVYDDNAGFPGTLKYLSTTFTAPAAGGTQQINICPSLTVNGKFYVGVYQFGTSNANFSYQRENPARSGAFYYNSPVAAGTTGLAVNDATTGWTDFGPDQDNFRLSIEAILENASAAPNCAQTPTPVDASTYQSKAITLVWGAPTTGSTASTYDVYFGTSPGSMQFVGNQCATTYTPPILLPGTTYYWKIVPRAVVLSVSTPATGCPTWSFTTAPNPVNDDCSFATTLTNCGVAIAGFTNNATQSVAPDNCNGVDYSDDDVWYKFTAVSAQHRITVTPTDGAFNAVIDVRSIGAGCPGTYIGCLDITGAGVVENISVTGLTVGQVYLVRVYSNANGTAAQGQFTIKLSTDGGWTGATSTDWNTASNWCDGTVPVSSTTATILAAANQPTLPASSTVLNLSMDNNTVLTVPGGQTINVQYNGGGGTLTGAGGTVNGTVILSSATAGQTSNVTGSVTVDKLQLANSTSVTVGGGALLNITDNATPSVATTLLNNGSVVLKSTATKTGYLGNWTGSSYGGTGNVFQERWLSGSPRWVFMGAPVSNATLNQWSELTPVLNPLNNASIFRFDETDSSRTFVNGAVAEINGWRAPAALANAINPAGTTRGYRVYVRNSLLGLASPVVSVGGNPYIGAVSAAVTKTAGQYAGGGYNLIANPYPAAIDVTGLTFNNVNPAIFTWNSATANYGVFINGGTNDNATVNGGSPFIASSQSFFVRATANGSVGFTEANKTATTSASFFRTVPVNSLRIAARDQAGHKEETLIRFRDGATDQFEGTLDAGALGGENIQLSSVIAGNPEYMDINTFPMLTGRRSVFLNVQSPSTGTAALDFSELESIDANVDVLLVDHLTGKTTNVRNQPSYSFSITSNPASKGDKRFEVVFSDARVTSVKANTGTTLSAWPNPASASQKVLVAVSGSIKGAANLQVADAAGRIVHTQVINLTGDANKAYEVNASLASGTYTIRCTTSSATMTTRLVVNQ